MKFGVEVPKSYYTLSHRAKCITIKSYPKASMLIVITENLC